MNSAEKQAVLHCLRSMIDEEVCEECPLYGTTGTDHCEKDCVRLAINALEQEPKTGKFIKMRDVTPEEQKMIDDYIKSISKPTGVDFGALEQEPCEDCICRQAAIDLADELKDDLPDDDRLSDMVMAHNEGILEYQTQLSLLPSVQPKQETGRWIMHIDDLFPADSTMECNKCHEHQPITIDDNYCPNCGAKMREVEE